MGITNTLYKTGAIGIISLQRRLPNCDGFFFTITKVSDPGYAFSVLVPLAASVHTLFAADLLVASLIAEWCNILLKWLLMEDRPFWWVRETGFDVPNSGTMRQTPLTCETGPGSPSGHVMGATAIMYVIREWIENYCIVSREISEKKKTILTILLRVVLVCAMILVSLSRLYVATHFPHQCVLGFILGLIVGRLLVCKSSHWTWWWRRGSRRRLLCIAAVLTSVSFGAYWLQRAFGIDPQWSVRMAFKWCESPEYLHVDTTPLYSLVRVSGAAIGVALSSPVYRAQGLRGSYVIRLGLSGAIVLLFQALSSEIPTKQAVLFYVLHLLLQSFQAWTLLWLLPKIVNVMPWPLLRRQAEDEKSQ